MAKSARRIHIAACAPVIDYQEGYHTVTAFAVRFSGSASVWMIIEKLVATQEPQNDGKEA